MSTLTAAQRRAVTHDGPALVVEAGAGTGKTMVLVARFLHLLVKNPDWPLESVVAITFTERAAREMRQRLRAEIERLASADELWAERRAQLSRLRVSTIHGFCAQLLRENAIAAEVDPLFTVLDEREAALLQGDALAQTLVALVNRGGPALPLLDVLQLGDLRRELAQLLAQRGTVTRLFDRLPEPERWLEGWRRRQDELHEKTWGWLVRRTPELAEALALVASVSITEPSDKLSPSVEAGQLAARLIGEQRWWEAMQVCTVINRRGGRHAAWEGKEALAELKAALGVLQTVSKTARETRLFDPLNEEDERAAAQLQQWRALWHRLNGTYDRLKRVWQALDFDDLELKSLHLLQHPGNAGRVAAFRRGIHHLLVDEYQDTNPTQRELIQALAPHDGETQLFVVGDAKQSIYRFRQAQVSVFNDTVHEIATRAGVEPVRLDASFRTHPGLLAALNLQFDSLLGPMGTRHEPWEAAPGPLCSEHPPLERGTPDVMIGVTLDPENRFDITQEREAEGRWLASQFRTWRQRGVPWGEMALLLRTTTGLDAYERALSEAGIPYVATAGRHFYERAEVQDALSLLAALHRPHDDLAVATVLRSPMFALSDETLYRLRWHGPDGKRCEAPRPFVEALSDPPPLNQQSQVARAHGLLLRFGTLRGRVSVGMLLARALHETGFEAALAMEDARQGAGGRRRANVRKLLSIAQEAETASVGRFLIHVNEIRSVPTREGEALSSDPHAGLLPIMTVHAAKGLEYRVVALADLGQSPHGGTRGSLVRHDPLYGLAVATRAVDGERLKPASYQQASWLDQRLDDAEAKRLLYVAMTRAKEHLILSGVAGTRDAALALVLEGWGIDEAGEAREVVTGEGYRIGVERTAL